MLAPRLGVQAESVVPLPALVGEIAAELGELVVGSASLGDLQGGVEGLGSGQPVRMLDRQQHFSSPLRIADASTEHEGVLRVAGVQQRADCGVQRRRRWRGEGATEERAADDRGAHVIGAAEQRFEEDALRRQTVEMDGEVATSDVVEQLRRQLGKMSGEHE